MKKLICAVIVFTVSTSASAFSGSDLLGQCQKFVEIIEGGKTDLNHTLQAGLCGGYVLGVQEGFAASSELAQIASEDQGTPPVSGKYWRIPDDVADETIVKIVVRYLEINSDMQSEPAVLSVIKALIQTYPAK
jgi:hypothetical protein